MALHMNNNQSQPSPTLDQNLWKGFENQQDPKQWLLNRYMNQRTYMHQHQKESWSNLIRSNNPIITRDTEEQQRMTAICQPTIEDQQQQNRKSIEEDVYLCS